MNHPALLLNADFQPVSQFPLSLLSWQDAVHAVYKGRVAVVAEYEKTVRSPTTEIRLPSVVALREYHPAPRRVSFTRFNVFLRDRFTCQYCAGKFKAEDLTFDHVVPRCRGGKTEWGNIVAACGPCNTAKDKFMLKPLTEPVEPGPWDLAKAARMFPPPYIHDSWRDFAYWTVELDE